MWLRRVGAMQPFQTVTLPQLLGAAPLTRSVSPSNNSGDSALVSVSVEQQATLRRPVARRPGGVQTPSPPPTLSRPTPSPELVLHGINVQPYQPRPASPRPAEPQAPKRRLSHRNSPSPPHPQHATMTLEFFQSPSVELDRAAHESGGSGYPAQASAALMWSPAVDPALARPLFKWLLLLNVAARLVLGLLPAALPELGAAFGAGAARLGFLGAAAQVRNSSTALWWPII